MTGNGKMLLLPGLLAVAASACGVDWGDVPPGAFDASDRPGVVAMLDAWDEVRPIGVGVPARFPALALVEVDSAEFETLCRHRSCAARPDDAECVCACTLFPDAGPVFVWDSTPWGTNPHTGRYPIEVALAHETLHVLSAVTLGTHDGAHSLPMWKSLDSGLVRGRLREAGFFEEMEDRAYDRQHQDAAE